ncbi:MAG TPA: hypothetical protein VF911_01600 [Thermoanaerobaculia bacterium]|jgi:uncharacterized membrane protein (DUF2068 family)
MERHIKILSILFMVFGVLGLLVAAGTFVFGAGVAASIFAAENTSDARAAGAVAGTCISVVAVLFALMAIPSIIAGWGLSRHKAWARILTIVLGVISLPQMPFGTALGIYAIIIMFNDDAKMLLRA